MKKMYWTYPCWYAYELETEMASREADHAATIPEGFARQEEGREMAGYLLQSALIQFYLLYVAALWALLVWNYPRHRPAVRDDPRQARWHRVRPGPRHA